MIISGKVSVAAAAAAVHKKSRRDRPDVALLFPGLLRPASA